MLAQVMIEKSISSLSASAWRMNKRERGIGGLVQAANGGESVAKRRVSKAASAIGGYPYLSLYFWVERNTTTPTALLHA